jgi:hypothetical protein
VTETTTCGTGENCLFHSNGILPSATTEKETLALLILGLVGGAAVLFMSLAGIAMILGFQRRRKAAAPRKFNPLDKEAPSIGMEEL